MYGILLFEAIEGTKRVAVSTPPVVSFPPFGGVMVGFGTGKSIFAGDYENNTQTQRFYSIYDKVLKSNPAGRVTAVNSDLSKMAKRVARTKTVDGKDHAYIETAAEISDSIKTSGFDPDKYDGWYLEYPALGTGSTVNGEMLISAPEVAVGQLFFTTIRPPTSTNLCFDSPLTRLWSIDPVVGTPKAGMFGFFYLADGKTKVNLAAKDSGGIQKRTIVIGAVGGKKTILGLGVTLKGEVDSLVLRDFTPSRMQWREVPNMRTLN